MFFQLYLYLMSNVYINALFFSDVIQGYSEAREPAKPPTIVSRLEELSEARVGAVLDECRSKGDWMLMCEYFGHTFANCDVLLRSFVNEGFSFMSDKVLQFDQLFLATLDHFLIMK